jgi:hypothetical protein
MPCQKQDRGMRAVATCWVLKAADVVPRHVWLAMNACKLVVGQKVGRRCLLKLCKTEQVQIPLIGKIGVQITNLTTKWNGACWR